MACSADHSDKLPRKAIEGLQDSQAGFWRHKCAGCAYELGRRDAAVAEERLRERVRILSEEVERLESALERGERPGH